LVYLIHSLSKSEKKHFAVSKPGEQAQDYMILYRMIAKSVITDEDAIRNDYRQAARGTSFDISVHYLYDKILDTLVALRKKKDIYYDLFRRLSKVRVLYERSMFRECFGMLEEVIARAQKNEIYEILLIAAKLELEYLLRLNFPNISEKELYHKHYEQVNMIKNIRKITEQASLYGLLRHRLTHKGNVRSARQKKELDDLMVSELSISASLPGKEDSFERTKNHKLFQATYLMGIGDFSAALRSFRELAQLFENNPHFWANPPIYYLSVLEGILSSLRSVGDYGEMSFFIKKLENMAGNYSLEFKINVLCLIFQYKLFPLFDQGDYEGCKRLIDAYKDSLFDNASWLSPIRKSEMQLYAALVHIGLRKYAEAKKLINSIIFDHDIEYLPIMRTIRLVRLIIYYETGNFDLVRHESHSIRRNLSLKKEFSFKTEHLMLFFLNKYNLPILQSERIKMHNKLLQKINDLHEDKYERQLLNIFDFTAWIESKALKRSLSDVIQSRPRSSTFGN
jgi:hypothetical protein